MLEQLSAEYILTARVKGLSERQVIWRHVFKNIRVQLITVIALSYANLLEGSVLTEIIFSWPGIGLITNALLSADMNAVLGGTIIVGLIFICLNIFSDLLYRIMDPRARWSYVAKPMVTSRNPNLAPHARMVNSYKGWQRFETQSHGHVWAWDPHYFGHFCCFCPWLAPMIHWHKIFGKRLLPMGSENHLLGTDSLGRDMLSRLIHGSRITLYIVIIVAIIAPLAGLLVGTVAGCGDGSILF